MIRRSPQEETRKKAYLGQPCVGEQNLVNWNILVARGKDTPQVLVRERGSDFGRILWGHLKPAEVKVAGSCFWQLREGVSPVEVNLIFHSLSKKPYVQGFLKTVETSTKSK